MENTLKKIIRKTGRKPVHCKCKECQKQCKTPCLGTPDDILRLIQAGYKDKLAYTGWYVGMLVGQINFPVPMVQPIQTDTGCIFFRNGLCELHEKGLKPTEGLLSHHSIKQDNCDFDKSLTWNVAKTWLDENNIATIFKVLREIIV